MPFVLFAADERRFGRDLYARRLAATLGAAVVPIGGHTPVADNAAYASAREAWDALETDARPLIAGSVLSAFVPMAGAFSVRGAAILIQEPLAAVRGQSDAERAIVAASEKQALALSPLIVASSEAAAAAIAAGAAVPSERVRVVEPPTPEYSRAVGSGAGETVIFAPGAPVTAAAHAVLFKALAGLRDLAWRLRIAGAGECAGDVAALVELAARFDIADRVHWQCCPDGVEDEALWRQSDLFADAAASAGYGLATAAAMKRGLPVVVAREANSRPQIPAEAGAMAPPDDHVQLGKALRRLIFDRDLRASMAEAAWQAGQLLPTAEGVRGRLLAALS